MSAEPLDQAGADAAQDDFAAFCELIGRPLTSWQLAALRLVKWMTVIIAPRQCGKSWSLAALCVWWAFRKPRQQILVISSVESSALDLLEEVREIISHPALGMSVTESLKFSVRLSNKSRIRSVTSTQRGIRGKSVDLLIGDEACYIDPEALAAAAIPTTAARPAARVVIASTPWATSGVVYQWAMSGMDPDNPIMQTHTWSLGQAPWINAAAIQAARQTLSTAQFKAEYEGLWVDGADSFFSAADIDAATASFPMTRDGGGRPAFMGLDWGGGEAGRDLQAIAIAGVLDDGGANGRAVVIVPYVETSRRDFPEQEAEVADIAARWDMTVLSEYKGLGIPPTRKLKQQLTRSNVIAVKTSEVIKEEAYSRLHHRLAERSIVLPDHPELRKQLLGIVAKPLPLGGLKIGSRTESIHDDLTDALAFALWGMPDPIAEPAEHDWPEGTQWVQTPGGIRVPLPVSTVRADASYADVQGGCWICGTCGAPVPAYKPACQTRGCDGRNPDWKPPPLASVPAVASPAPAGDDGDPESVPIANYMRPGMRECLRDQRHRFDGSASPRCPWCYPGQGRAQQAGGGMPDPFRRALGMGPFGR